MPHVEPDVYYRKGLIMTNRIHLIMPMGGKGSRFTREGFDLPKPLIKIHGRPFFYWATQSIKKFIDLEDLIFIVLQEHIDHFQLDSKILEYYPEAVIHVIPDVLNGAALTCLEGVAGITDQKPIVFNDCDHMFKSKSFEYFLSVGFDTSIAGGLLTFTSGSPKYSFLQLNSDGNVTQTVEKIPVSEHAVCGCYYFRSKADFEAAVKVYLRQCEYKEFFVSGIYNVMAKQGQIIKAFPTDFHVPFGVPEEYEEAKSSTYFDVLI